MKKALWIAGTVVLLFSLYVVYTMATTRKHSPAAVASLKSGDTEISINYCRPFKKGRKIFGGLVPYQTYWRTGANDPSIIEFTDEVEFGGEKVAAGRYRIYTIPGEDEWKVVLNTELEEWGYWEPDYSLDVAAAVVPVSSTSEVQEQFLMELTENEGGALIAMSWDQTKVEIPIFF